MFAPKLRGNAALYSLIRHSRSPRGWLAVWAIGVALLSLLPLHFKRAIGTTGELHEVGHVVSFAITSVLFLQCSRPGAWAVWRLWPVLAFAFTLELLEAALYGNALEWRDIRSDTLGTSAGVLAYLFCKACMRRAHR
jgi:hypothetical protein